MGRTGQVPVTSLEEAAPGSPPQGAAHNPGGCLLVGGRPGAPGDHEPAPPPCGRMNEPWLACARTRVHVSASLGWVGGGESGPGRSRGPPPTHPCLRFPRPPRTPTWRTCPPHILRLVYKEVTTPTSDPPDGIKVFPNEEDLTDLQVTIEGPEGTPYAGGLFRMKLLLGKDFPAAPPKGFFLTKIFHPNVGANGEICVNVLKRDWTAELGIRHVLLTIKCLLIHPNPESALNEEAGRLLLEDYEEYAARARLLTEIHGGAGGPGAVRAARAGPGGAEAGPAEAGASSSSPPGPGAEGPMAKKHAGERDKKLAAKKKTDKKRALRRL
uniref:E2 ubiquitin-conjugating enzyme n=1 Tax=Vombatus ursinus TaxID=29139 RepID=A0A4X2JXH2_VOMUR